MIPKEKRKYTAICTVVALPTSSLLAVQAPSCSRDYRDDG